MKVARFGGPSARRLTAAPAASRPPHGRGESRRKRVDARLQDGDDCMSRGGLTVGRKKSLFKLLVGKPGPLRPQNFCGACGHSWYPRGKSFSPRCPNCGVDRAPASAPTGSSISSSFVVLGCVGVMALALTSLCCIVATSTPPSRRGESRAPAPVPAPAPVSTTSAAPGAGEAPRPGPAREHLCGSPHARGTAAHRAGWSRWHCRSESDTPWWEECLPRTAYAVHHGEGCPGAQLCCPPSGRDGVGLGEAVEAP